MPFHLEKKSKSHVSSSYSFSHITKGKNFPLKQMSRHQMCFTPQTQRQRKVLQKNEEIWSCDQQQQQENLVIL